MQQDPPDALLQLPDIAGPVMVRRQVSVQGLQDAFLQPAWHPARDPGKQVMDQQGEFLRAFPDPPAQGRDGDHVGAEPVVEVVAEAALVAQGGQVPVGGGNDPAGKPLPAMTAHRGEGPLLEHPQQLDLDRDRDLADLVEKDGAVRAGTGKDTVVRLHRAGEGAAGMAEEF